LICYTKSPLIYIMVIKMRNSWNYCQMNMQTGQCVWHSFEFPVVLKQQINNKSCWHCHFVVMGHHNKFNKEENEHIFYGSMKLLFWWSGNFFFVNSFGWIYLQTTSNSEFLNKTKLPKKGLYIIAVLPFSSISIISKIKVLKSKL